MEFIIVCIWLIVGGVLRLTLIRAPFLKSEKETVRKVRLEKGEFTKDTLVAHLNEKFGGKALNNISKERTAKVHIKFTKNDVSQYMHNGYLPEKYGGQKVIIDKSIGVPIITLGKPKRKD